VAGTGADTINLTGLAGTITLGATQLSISDSTTITGPGAATLSVDAATNSRVFYIYNNAAALNVTISGLTITRGRSAIGANLSSKGETVTLSSVTVSNGSATAPGGGIYISGGALTIQSSTLSGNTTSGGGGGGGAVYANVAGLTINNTIISGNSASSPAARGGAISVNAPNQPITITNTQILNNSTVGKAGAVAVKTGSGSFTMQHCVVTGNTSSGRGGAFFLYRMGGTTDISNTKIDNNTSQNRGAGMFLYNVFANVTITDSSISGNNSPSGTGNGAGIFFYKASAGVSVTLERTTMTGNTAARAAGAIFFYKGSGELRIANSTISGNSSGTTGGGIFDRGPFGGGAALTIINSTISGNSAVTSGGNLNATAVSTTVRNSIIANGSSPVGPDATTGGANVTIDYSLLENTSGATFAGSNNITGIDPNLGPLQDNGGPTLTHRPNTGSPPLDAGDPGFTPPPSTDQRGLARVYNGRIDLGSLEQGAMSSFSFTSAGTTVAESAGTANVAVIRSSGEGTASVTHSTANGTATASADYTATSGTLNWAAGDFAAKTITVPILEDTIDESNEFFNVNLSLPSNATLGSPSSATITINDNDAVPSIGISGVTQAEGNSGTTAFSFVVTLSNPSSATATVNYTTASGTANTTDYTPQSGTITFAPGVTVQTVSISVLGDTLAEGNETFTVTLSSPTNSTIGTAVATGTINNDDAAPALSIGDVSLAEGNSSTTSFSFPVTLSAPSAQTITVNYTTVNGTAVAGTDFTTASGTLTFAPGITTQNAVVSVTGDTTNEANETFSVTLNSPTNATIADATGAGTIVNDDAVVTLSIGDVSQAEGNSGTSNFSFPVTLSTVSEQTVTVDYTTSDGTALAGSDYAAASGTLTFAPGVTTQNILVAVNGDTTSEPNEAFNVTLATPSNATLADSTATGGIADDDIAPSLSIGSVSQAEGNSGTTTFSFPVTLSAPSGRTVTVNYATSNGTANAGSDYGATSGTLTFAPGVTSQIVNVPVTGDASSEPDETFTVTLSAPFNATLTAPTATGTIVNDDTAPSISIAGSALTEGDSGATNMPFNVTLSTASEQTVTVNFTTVDGSAVAGSDFTASSGGVTFAPGVTSQTINVPILGDTTSETDEAFTIALSAPLNATIATGTATGTIVNDDGVVTVSVGDVTQAEGNGGMTAFTFPVTLSAASEQTITVNYATSNGTASSGSDYAAASGTVTFAPGVTSQSITVLVNGDTTSEPNETFLVTLGAPVVNATLADSTATGTITDDDTAPTLSIGNVTQAEGNSGTTTFSFPVTLSTPSGQTVTVAYATSNGTALAGSDYGATSGTVTFAPGVTSQMISIPVTGDLTSETDETFTVTLDTPSNATLATTTGTGTIVNDDTAPAISIANASLTEGNSGSANMTFNVTLSTPSEQPITVNFTTVDGSAVAGSDFTASSGVLTFAPGTTTQTIDVPILGDTLSENDETFTVALNTASNATITNSSGTGTIVNDDAVVSVSIGDVSQAEGNSGTANFAFTVTLSAASEQTVTVNYTTVDGTAVAGTDYTATSGTVTFAPGVTTQTINVPVSGDLTKEATETFSVALSSPVNASLGTATGTGTIVDDDNAPVLAIDNVSLAEGDTASTNFAFTVTLSQPSGETVTVNYATADATATAGEDYGATSGTLTFAPGVTSQTINVPVLGDAVSEPDETFTVALSSATNAPIGTTTGTGTIINDDSAPALTINDAAQPEGDSGAANMTFTVALSAPSEETITVNYSTANGSALAGSDYSTTSGTLTFAPGVTSQTIDAAILGDVASEPDETFNVVLSAPTNAAIADASATGTILTDDAPYVPAISINDTTTFEGDSGTTPVTFTLTLDAATTQTVTVDYHTTNINAQQGQDFVGTTGSVSFPPGTTSRTVTIGVIGDTVVEPNETFALDLSSPTGATIADPRGIATIVNDDNTTQPPPEPRINITGARVTEGDSGIVDAALTVQLSNATSADVTVDYTTIDGTAHSGSDYALTSGTLVFPAGTTSRVIHVPVLGDTIVEGDETFSVRLSSPNGGRINTGQATVTIVDDDITIDTPRGYIAIAGATPGAGGSYFRTSLQLHNTSDAPAVGQVVFHLTTGGTPAIVPYSLAPHQTLDLDDAALANGIGSIDLVSITGPAPIAVVRINSTSDCGTVGMSTQSLDATRDALTAPAHAVLLAPADLGTSRFNIGIRAIASPATVRLTLHDAAGNTKTQLERAFAAETLVHTAAADLLGTAVAANDSIEIEVLSGTVIAYGATTDNTSQDPALQLARPLP
jgi:hypothetical protein